MKLRMSDCTVTSCSIVEDQLRSSRVFWSNSFFSQYSGSLCSVSQTWNSNYPRELKREDRYELKSSLGGAAAMSDQLGGLYYCNGSICSLARATQAFAWLTWITLTVLLALVATLAILSTRNTEQSVWTRPLDHEHVQVGHSGGGGGQGRAGLAGRWHGKNHEKEAQPSNTTSQPTSNTAPAPVMSSAQV